MKLVALLVGSVLVLASAGASVATEDATCKRVNKMLEMGRTTEDIVQNSAGTITEEDVERCKAEKQTEGGGSGGEEKKATE